MRNYISKVISLFKLGYGIKELLNRERFLRKRNDYIKSQTFCGEGNEKYAHVTLLLAGNTGDDVLSECVRKTVRSYFPVEQWEIVPVRDAVSKKTIETINSCSKLWVGGGGLFLPDSNINDISGWQWPVSSEQIDMINVPIIIFSVGYNFFPGQVPNEIFKSSLKCLVKKSSFVGLRNQGSIDAVKSILPLNLQAKIKYQPCTTTIIRKIYNDLIPPKMETGKIAINMAFDREELRFGNRKEEILNSVAKTVKKLEIMGYEIHYVCHCVNDRKFIPWLKKWNIKYELNDMVYCYPLDVIKFYNEMDTVIGMRGHAQMIPFGVNCEIISLGTHDKMKWFLEDINATDWYVNLNQNDGDICENIIQIFLDIHSKEETKKRLIDAQNMLWDITQGNLKFISSIRRKNESL